MCMHTPGVWRSPATGILARAGGCAPSKNLRAWPYASAMPELKLRPPREQLERWRAAADGRPLAPFLVRLVDEAVDRRELEARASAERVPAGPLAQLDAVLASIQGVSGT